MVEKVVIFRFLDVLKEKKADCLSITKARARAGSPEERENAICALFDVIVILRSSGRLKGNLMTINVEKRLAKIEKGLAETKKVVMELVIFYRSIVENKGKKKG